MSGFLRIDYEKAMAQAKELEGAAERCGQSLSNLRNEKGALGTYWVGESGNAMREQIAVAEGNLTSAQSQLIAIAASIRRVADELKRADETIKGLIEGFGDSGLFG
ncbi:MAG: WXG100 family type VII secretion target [Lachnospiraceae bacterium]|nr:WXG100 family type VII secretion target [Lachnospiraceae bacterium]